MRSVKTTEPMKGEKHAGDFEKEMAERATALMAAGKMPTFEDVQRAVAKISERGLSESTAWGGRQNGCGFEPGWQSADRGSGGLV